jgi:hypothetical protein
LKSERSSRIAWHPIAIAVAVCALVRGSIIAVTMAGIGPLGTFDADPDGYRLLAETLASTGVFGIPTDEGPVDPTAFRPPLYPWVISWFVGTDTKFFIAVGVLHTILGSLTCGVTFVVTGQWTKNLTRRYSLAIPILATTLVAIDPLLITQSTLVMTETLATALAAAVWLAITLAMRSCDRKDQSGGASSDNWVLAVGSWVLVAVLLALSFLCRPTFLVWTFLIVIWLVGRALESRKHRLAFASAAAVIAVVSLTTVAAWTARNQAVVGRPIWATTHGGYTLLLGNNPYFYDDLVSRSFLSAGVWGESWDAEPFHQEWRGRLDDLDQRRRIEGAADDPELSQDQMASDWSKQTIVERPRMFVYACLVRVARLWSPIPRVGDSVTRTSILIGVFYAAVYLCGAIAIARFGRRLAGGIGTPAFLLAVALTVVHAVYWSNIRMRAPVEPMLMTLAALAFVKQPPAGRASPE